MSKLPDGWFKFAIKGSNRGEIVAHADGKIDLEHAADRGEMDRRAACSHRIGIVESYKRRVLPSSVFTIELGGKTAGSLSDQLAATDKVTLDGRLNVILPGAFFPTLGGLLRPLTVGSRIRVFAHINGLDLGGGRLHEPVYDAGNLGLTVI